MTAVIARIALRYGAGALIAKGLLAPELGNQISGDADLLAALQVVLGLAAGGASELFYIIARRRGWKR